MTGQPAEGTSPGASPERLPPAGGACLTRPGVRQIIGPQSRERLVAAVIAALDGTGAEAVREELTAARDRAAAALNFELAARIQDGTSASAAVRPPPGGAPARRLNGPRSPGATPSWRRRSSAADRQP
ncbi:hypothetical protein ACIBO5_23345 [Nonomuraea angiospora]|uniref:hypothetical protein n=1 Tax=Nonomuraea angiospora TaxID=46172 RepID=UPI003790D8F8